MSRVRYKKVENRLFGLKEKTWRDIIIIVFILFLVSWVGIEAKKREAVKIISPLAMSAYAMENVTPTPTEVPMIIKGVIDTQKDIEAYIKTIFGKDSNIAIAISHNECNPANAKYPECVLHSDVEYSVGVFQINLYNAKQWIHAGRIPGKTMDEKVEWLKKPYNNTLYAYWVFKTSGWNPWTAYTNGNYLKSL